MDPKLLVPLVVVGFGFVVVFAFVGVTGLGATIGPVRTLSSSSRRSSSLPKWGLRVLEDLDVEDEDFLVESAALPGTQYPPTNGISIGLLLYARIPTRHTRHYMITASNRFSKTHGIQVLNKTSRLAGSSRKDARVPARECAVPRAGA